MEKKRTNGVVMKTVLIATLFLVAAAFVGHLPSQWLSQSLTWLAIEEQIAMQMAHGVFLIGGICWAANALGLFGDRTTGADGEAR